MNKTPVAPKQRELTRVESITSFNAWRDNFLYVLATNKNFERFLTPNASWGRFSSTDLNRGFTDDTGENAVTKEEKVKQLNLFLGQIANYAPVISRNQITKNSTSLNDIWKKLKEHYGIQTSGAKFIDVINIRLSPGERYEDLYQRLLAFFEDSLLTTDCGLTHHGQAIANDEDLSPSLENTVVLTWLERIHVGLPGLVKQKYGAELRNKTLSSLKSEISSALESLLSELNSADGAGTSRVMRSSSYNNNNPGGSRFRQQGQLRSNPFCCLCHAEKRPDTAHWLSRCSFLPDGDKKRFQLANSRGGSNKRVQFRQVGTEDGEEVDSFGYVEEDVDDSDLVPTEDNPCFIDKPLVHRRVTTRKSPHLRCFLGHSPVSVCLDTGAESNLVSKRFTDESGIPLHRATQGAVQADSKTSLGIVGEIKGVILTRGPYNFVLDALVSDREIGDVIGGEPFLEKNDIAVRPGKKQIIIGGRDIIPYHSQ